MCTEYIKQLYFLGPNKEKVFFVKSSLKTGFLGLLVLAESVKNLYMEYVVTDEMSYLCLYKFSQDHLELLFAVFRSMFGCNNNPTAEQFSTAYQKYLAHRSITAPETANCTELYIDENFDDLTVDEEDFVHEFGIKKISDINPVISARNLNLQLNEYHLSLPTSAALFKNRF